MVDLWLTFVDTYFFQPVGGILLPLKGQCHENFDHFLLKDSTWPHMNRQKWFFKLFRFCEDIREKRVSA